MSILNRLSLALRALGPLAPAAAFFLVAMTFLSLSRLGLSLIYAERLAEVPDAWRLFVVGLRMDSMSLSYLLLLPAVPLLLLPSRWGGYWKPIMAGAFAVGAGLLVYMEVASVPFLAQYDSRPNQIFIEYLVYPQEVLGTLWAEYKLELFLAALAVGLAVHLSWRMSRHLLETHAPWGPVLRLAVLPLVVVALFLGARSSLDHRAANISDAAFSSDHLSNQLALNSTYSVLYALYSRRHEADSRHLYGSLPDEEMFARVRRAMTVAASDFMPGAENPLLHRQQPTTRRERPYNLVIVLEESLGAEYVGILGGKPLTPNFDALSREGLLLTELYSTGTRTVRGIEAVISGFLPTPGRSVVKLGLAQHQFVTLASLLKSQGYATEFIYGGRARFDNMGSFFRGNGFGRVVEQGDFAAPAFEGTWGLSDEDLARKANEVFRAHGDEPFFGLMLSTSNHSPFEYPPGRIEPYDEPASTVHNAMKYADFALGEFFRLARQESYYENTVFLVVADHNTRVFGADLVPVNKFHIPGLIIAPNVRAGTYDKLASQIDLAPTLLSLLGVEAVHPMVGRDLLALPAETPGRAFMQYGETNAYRVEDRVVIHQPGKLPLQFRYVDQQLVPAELDPELAQDALAHLQLPSVLYQKQLYRLPPPQLSAVEQ